jgi:8-oxo-dGTP diphosphatase
MRAAVAMRCGGCGAKAAGGGRGSEMQEDLSAGRAVKRGVVAVARRGELYLAIRRGRAVAAGGRVCFPGGHIEPGEEEHEAVVRECREELAAVVEPAECVHRSVTAWGTSLAWWTVQLADGELVPHPVEVSEILWLTAEEMLEHPDLLQGNRPFLEAVIAGRLVV